MKRRIVITGAGVISALGYSRQELFQSLLDGKSAVKERPDWIEKMQTTKVAIASAVELPQEVANPSAATTAVPWGQLHFTRRLPPKTP